MIIKSLSWKKLAPAILANYINDIDKVKGTQPIYWNTSNHSMDAVVRDFMANDQYLNLRVNSNRMLHEVISYSPLDNESLNEDKVRDLIFEYLRLRAETQIAYGEIHKGDNWHVHLMLTPNGICDHKMVQIKKPQYLKIRYDMEAYQIAKFPELKNSLIFIGKNKAKVKTNEKQFQLEKRSQGISKTSQITNKVKQYLDGSSSLDEFLDTLLQNNYIPYKYRNKTNGVMFEGKKYRFSRLGVDKAMLESLKKQEKTLVEQRLSELKRIDKPSPSKSKGLCR